MFPIYGLLWLIVPLVRYAIGRRKGKRGGVRTAIAPGPSTVTLQFLGLLVGIPLFLLALEIPSAWLALLSLACLAVGFAPPLAHLVAVPLGMPRLACGLYRYSGAMGPVHERPGNAALVAARAFMRRPTDEGARFIEAYLKTCLEVGTSGAAASAILAVWRGDRDQAASILRLLAETDAPCGAGARRLARKYVLLTHALTPVEGAAAAAAPVAPTFAAHAALLARSPSTVREKDVAAAVLSLDQLRTSSAWRARIEQRALALGLSIESRSVEDEAMREAEEDVAAVLLAGRLPSLWAPEGPSGDAIRTLVQEARLRQAESLVRELARRVRERSDLPEPDEWRAWADAKQACADLQRDGTDASTVFDIAFNAMTGYAVRLVNIRARRVLARDVFHYARSVARAAQATHVMELAERNVKAIEAYRLPNQSGIEGILLSDRKRVAVWSRAFPVLIPGAIAVFVVLSVLSGAFAFGMVLMLGVVFAIWLVFLRLIECEHTADGLVVQGRAGRYVAAPEDILSVQSGPGPLLRIRLQRVPFGLPRRILTITKSNAHARAHAERLRTELRLET
ncbi:MAG TPA: hypothetical protein VK841_11945 [Polyangiaceae bacterium]|jgi:hypothetical protein|nr:hypothetical protein [Polyangiaceae bacterium]